MRSYPAPPALPAQFAALPPRLYVFDGLSVLCSTTVRFLLRHDRAGPLLPPRFNDQLYGWIARHRYGLFGRRQACLAPDPAIAWRFVD